MELSSLTAISPIDGRYGDKTRDLRVVSKMRNASKILSAPPITT